MLIIYICTAVFFVCIVFAAAVVIYDKMQQNRSSLASEDGTWLFQQWEKAIYCLLFHKSPEEVAPKLGIDVRLFRKNCAIAQVDFQLETIIIRLILGILLLVIFSLAAIVVFLLASNIGAAILVLCGCICFFFLAYLPVRAPEKKANQVKAQIMTELPRFLDMLETALYIDLPITDAVTITARYLKDTRLAQELLSSLAEVQFGVYDWQQALKQMAEKFEIDAFSDFVLDLVISYEKGMNVYESVSRKNREIKQTHVLQLKANAQKLNSTLLFPIMGFKMVPLILIIGVPLIEQLLLL